MRLKVLYFTSGIIWITMYSAWHFAGQYTFEIGQAIMIFAATYLGEQHFKKNWFARFLFFVGSNNLYDEILGDPEKVTYQEYIIALLFLSYYIVNDKLNLTTKIKKWLLRQWTRLKR